MGQSGLRIYSRHTSYEARGCGGELPGFVGCPCAMYKDGTTGSRMEKVLSLRRIDKE